MRSPLFPPHLWEFVGLSLVLAALTTLDFVVLWAADHPPLWAVEFNFPLYAFLVFLGVMWAMAGGGFDTVQNAVGRAPADSAVLIIITAAMTIWLILPTLISFGVLSWSRSGDGARIHSPNEDHAPSRGASFAYLASALLSAATLTVLGGWYFPRFMMPTGSFDLDFALAGLQGGLPMALLPLLLMFARRCLRRCWRAVR